MIKRHYYESVDPVVVVHLLLLILLLLYVTVSSQGTWTKAPELRPPELRPPEFRSSESVMTFGWAVNVIQTSFPFEISTESRTSCS